MTKEKVEIEKQNKKIKAYEDFLIKGGATVTHAQKENLENAGSYLYHMYMFCPKYWHNDLDELANLIRDYKWKEASKIVQNLFLKN